MWVRIKRNTGRAGETWLKKGDVTLVCGKVSPPYGNQKEYKIGLYSFRTRRGFTIGSASIKLSVVEFLEEKDEEMIFNLVERHKNKKKDI